MAIAQAVDSPSGDRNEVTATCRSSAVYAWKLVHSDTFLSGHAKLLLDKLHTSVGATQLLKVNVKNTVGPTRRFFYDNFLGLITNLIARSN